MAAGHCYSHTPTLTMSICVCVCDMQTAIRAFSHAGKLIQRRLLGQLVQQQLIVAFMCVCACVVCVCAGSVHMQKVQN